MKIILGRRIFSCSITLIIIYILVLLGLIGLGFWQLDRAEVKRSLLQQQQMQVATVLEFKSDSEDNADKLRYKPIIAHGHYDITAQFLCDNQIVNGKAGYFVLTPFILAGGKKAVLVNRGWVVANPNRHILPNVRMKTLPTVIKGRINKFPSVGIKLAGAETPTNTVPAVVQVVDSQVLAKKLGYSLFSFQVELDPATAEGYKREWLNNTLMPPEQHIAYAMQWFGLGIALTILFFWYSIEKQTDD
jgi:surfeit locus 1 family protein